MSMDVGLLLIPLLLGLLVLGASYFVRRLRLENLRRLEAEQSLVDLTDRLPTGVFQFRQRRDRQICPEYFNTRAREMARIEPGPVPTDQLPFLPFVDALDIDRVRTKLGESLKTGQTFTEACRFHFSDNEQGWILADAQCRTDNNGERVWSGYLFDLTSERLLYEELNALVSSKDNLMAAASREFRGPIQNISHALNEIDESAVAPAERRSIRAAMSASRDLEVLADDFMEIARLNLTEPTLDARTFDLIELVHHTRRTFAADAAAKRIELAVIHADDMPRTFVGDPPRIKRVITNIIGNAVKYTNQGAVKVIVRRAVSGALRVSESASSTQAFDSVVAESLEAMAVEILVADSGIGIRPEDIDHIFKPFRSIGPPARRSGGIGLALCDRLVAVMDGTITVESILGVGSTFTVTLPLATPKGAGVEVSGDRESELKPSLDDTSTSLLLVDDNLLVRETLAALLGAEGWQVMQAESTEQALTLLDQNDFRAVITDYQMPGRNGYELASEIHPRFRESACRPVLIMMSGGLPRETAAQATKVFDAMLFKPVKAAEISRTIREISGVSQAEPV